MLLNLPYLTSNDVFKVEIMFYQKMMMLIRVKFVLFCVLFLASDVLLAQELLTENEAINKVLEQNYAIKIAQSQVTIAKQNNTKGNAGMLPTLTGNVSKNYNVTNTQLRFFDEKIPEIKRKGVQNNTGNVGIVGSWTIYDGKGMFIARDQLGTLQQMSENNVKTLVSNTVAQVLQAYYEVVRAEKRVKNFKNGLLISGDRMKLAKDRYEVGQGSKVDYLSAQVDYNQDKSDVIAAEQVLSNNKMALNALLLRDPAFNFKTNDSILIDSTLTLAEIRESILALNPNLQQAKLNKNLAFLDLKSTKAAQMPSVDLLAGYNYNTLNNGAGAPQSTKHGQTLALNYGLRASINIFDGYNQKRRIENAKINTEIVDFQEKDLKNQLELMAGRNYQNYRNALEVIKLEQENYQIAHLNTEIAFERYRVGNSTAYELREVQRNAVAAETRLIEAEYQAKVNEIELHRLMGAFIKLN